MVANTRVPIASVAIKRNGQWTSLSAKTSDNYFEYHGEGLLVQVAWRGRAVALPPICVQWCGIGASLHGAAGMKRNVLPRRALPA